jgi:c-di-GMP-binding flagellar brake protein YcgR
VPAVRSRTENWRRSLNQIHERGGALEITLPRYVNVDDEGNAVIADTQGDDDGGAKNIIWRVRILELTDDAIVVEEPSAMGQTFELQSGIQLVAIIAIGQNRWMFKTTNRGKTRVGTGARQQLTGLRLDMPSDVERCQRRNFYRVSTVGLELPTVEMYPLLDPTTTELAETASREEILAIIDRGSAGRISPDKPILPDVGPPITAKLLNIGGGGVGLILDPEDAGSIGTNPNYWLRIALPPHIPMPLAVSARLRHTHIDSEHRTYAGFAFDFSYNPKHQKFVVDQLCRYVALLQREQLKRDTA